MARGVARRMAAGMAILAAGCAHEPSWLEVSVPLVEAMSPQVALAHGTEPMGEIRVGPLPPRPGVIAMAIFPNRILIHPALKEEPRSMMLWAVTHELAHLYGGPHELPWPFSLHREALEEARVELLTGDLLPGLEPAARRLRSGTVRWIVDRVRAARETCGLRPSRADSIPQRFLWSLGRP